MFGIESDLDFVAISLYKVSIIILCPRGEDLVQ